MSKTHHHVSRQLWLLPAVVAMGLTVQSPVQARQDILDTQTLQLLRDPLETRWLYSDTLPTDGSVMTSYSVSQDSMTIPSLWWVQRQFGGKLLDRWQAFSGKDGTPPRVELVVNEQIWSIYTYLERYTFLNQFGTAAKAFGYNTRIFNHEGEFLAAYLCNFSNGSPACRVFLDSSGRGGLQGSPSSPGAAAAIPGGTAQP
jgi:hypothetical protein